MPGDDVLVPGEGGDPGAMPAHHPAPLHSLDIPQLNLLNQQISAL